MEENPPLIPPPPPPAQNLDLDDIKALKVLGKGAMGTVFLAYNTLLDPSASNPFALKVVEKPAVPHHHHADRRAKWEITVLSTLSPHPFLPSLLGSFDSAGGNEDDGSLTGWAVPYCPGGDLNVLRYHQTDRMFSPAAIKFYLAEIICALEHLHSVGIAYRDLKPENVLIQRSGHVTLTDFDLSRRLNRRVVERSEFDYSRAGDEESNPSKGRGGKHRKNLARIFASGTDTGTGLKKTKSARVSPVSRRETSVVEGERSNSFVGTEEYVSPEVVRGDGHEFAVDWWALGVLAYEMLYGRTPFRGKNRKETFGNVLMKAPEFVGRRTPLVGLIESLLEKDPTKRLGYCRGAAEIKEHEFFKGLKWDLLTEVLRPPFVPAVVEVTTAGAFDVRDYFRRLRVQQLEFPSSPLRSSREEERDISIGEF